MNVSGRRTILIKKERTPSGYTTSIEIFSIDASKHVVAKKRRAAFPEVRKDDLSFSCKKGWGAICVLLAPDEGNPISCWGKHSEADVLKVARQARLPIQREPALTLTTSCQAKEEGKRKKKIERIIFDIFMYCLIFQLVNYILHF